MKRSRPAGISKDAFPLLHSHIVFCGGRYFIPTPRKWWWAAKALDLAVIALCTAVFGPNFMLAGLVYLRIGDGLFRGASIGKRLIGARVIETTHGCPCTILQDFIDRDLLVVRRSPLSDAEIEELYREWQEVPDPTISKRLTLQEERDKKAVSNLN
jgi:hypothetical protein